MVRRTPIAAAMAIIRDRRGRLGHNFTIVRSSPAIGAIGQKPQSRVRRVREEGDASGTPSQNSDAATSLKAARDRIRLAW